MTVEELLVANGAEMMHCSRRDFLKWTGGAGLGLLAGSIFSVVNPRSVLSAGELKVKIQGGFPRLIEPGRIVVHAQSLQPKIQLRAAPDSPRQLKLEITNVRASQLELKCDGLKNISLQDTAISADLTLNENGDTIIESSYTPLTGERLNFIAFSDTHLGDIAAEEHFSRILAHTNLRRPLFAVDAGDTVDVDDPVQYKSFEKHISNLKVPIFTTIGNHESYLSTKLYRKYEGSFYYSFTIDGTQFLFLDNAQKQDNATLVMDGPTPNEQWDWLTERLNEPARRRFVFFHYPVYGQRCMTAPENVKRNTVAEREAEVDRMARLFRASGVNCICFGHVHSPERKEIDGIVHLRLGGGGGSRASSTDDNDVSFAHIFVDDKGIRDYTVYFYFKPEEVEKIAFCEAREKLPVGAREPIVVHGVGKNRLLGIDPYIEIISGPGRLEEKNILVADSPGRVVIGADYGNLTARQEIQIV